MIGKGIELDMSRSGFLAEGVRAVSILMQHTRGADTPLLRVAHDILTHRAPPISILYV